MSGADSSALADGLPQYENHRNTAEAQKRDVAEIVYVRPEAGLLGELEV